MRILIVSGIFHPEPGGPATYLAQLLPDLIARGHQVRVLTYGEASTDGYGYPVTRISRQQSIPARLWQYTRAVLRHARWADVIYVQGYAYPTLAARLLLRRPLVTKVVSDFVWEFSRRRGWTDLDVTAFQTAHLPWKVRLLRAVDRGMLRQSRAVIVPSAHVAQLARGWGLSPNRIHVIHNAIPRTGLSTVPRADLRAEMGWPPDVFTLISVGRLTAVKGVDVALRALEHLPGVRFVVVGEGEQQPELEALAAPYGDRVQFVGRQSHDEVLRMVCAADVFVLSSHTEGLSHVLLEALEVGTPAVATEVGGNCEILTHEDTGLLVPPDDPPALAAAVAHLRDDPDLAARLAAQGRRRSEDFDWDQMVTRTEALLRGEA